jgi:hypothetical protein
VAEIGNAEGISSKTQGETQALKRVYQTGMEPGAESIDHPAEPW